MLSAMEDKTYLLIIHVKNNKKLKIGKLGTTYFKKGYYLYVGSAKKNIKTRISRHLNKYKKLFWHIDYLLFFQGAHIKEIWTGNMDECQMAQFLLKNEYRFVDKFGSSDCSCPSHLFFMKNVPEISQLIKEGFIDVMSSTGKY